MFTHTEWDSMAYTAYVSSFTTLLGDIFLLLSFYLNPPRREYPFNLFFNLCGASLMVSVCFMVELGYGKDAFLCHNGSPSTQEFAPCGAQGFMLVFFTLATCCWWLIICVNLYMILHGKITKANQTKWMRYYYIFGWGYPSLALLIGGSTATVEMDMPSIFCFLSDDPDQVWVQYGLVYVPLGIMVTVGGVIIISIFYQSFRAWQSVKELDASRTRQWPYFRVCFFSMGFFFIWLMIFFTRTSLIPSQDVVQTAFNEWIQCNKNVYIQNEPTNNCGVTPSPRTNMGVLITQYICLSVHGLLLVVVFCSDPEIWAGWKVFFAQISEKVQLVRQTAVLPKKAEKPPMSLTTSNVDLQQSFDQNL